MKTLDISFTISTYTKGDSGGALWAQFPEKPHLRVIGMLVSTYPPECAEKRPVSL